MVIHLKIIFKMVVTWNIIEKRFEIGLDSTFCWIKNVFAKLYYLHWSFECSLRSNFQFDVTEDEPKTGTKFYERELYKTFTITPRQSLNFNKSFGTQKKLARRTFWHSRNSIWALPASYETVGWWLHVAVAKLEFEKLKALFFAETNEKIY